METADITVPQQAITQSDGVHWLTPHFHSQVWSTLKTCRTSWDTCSSEGAAGDVRPPTSGGSCVNQHCLSRMLSVFSVFIKATWIICHISTSSTQCWLQKLGLSSMFWNWCSALYQTQCLCWIIALQSKDHRTFFLELCKKFWSTVLH